MLPWWWWGGGVVYVHRKLAGQGNGWDVILLCNVHAQVMPFLKNEEAFSYVTLPPLVYVVQPTYRLTVFLQFWCGRFACHPGCLQKVFPTLIIIFLYCYKSLPQTLKVKFVMYGCLPQGGFFCFMRSAYPAQILKNVDLSSALSNRYRFSIFGTSHHSRRWAVTMKSSIVNVQQLWDSHTLLILKTNEHTNADVLFTVS